jgi:hypothetical protein
LNLNKPLGALPTAVRYPFTMYAVFIFFNFKEKKDHCITRVKTDSLKEI